jgi:hypothetical protein
MATLEFFGKEHGRLINTWEDNIKCIWNCEDRTGSGSCPVAGFSIRGFEPSGSATRELIN